MAANHHLPRIALAPTLAAVSAAAMLLLTIVTLQVVGHTLTKQVETDIGHNLSELAFQTTDKLDRGMYERYREVRLMAERSEITDPKVSTAVKRNVLEVMQSTHPYYAWIGLTDNHGTVKIATKGLLETADVSARPWFAGAYNGVNLHDVHDAVLLARLLPNPGGEPTRFFDIAFPYRGPDGAIAGVFGAHLSWQWAADIERSVLRPLAAREGVDTLILSRDGAVLLGPKEYTNKVLDPESFRRARQGGNGSVIETWPDGKRYLVGYSQSRGRASSPVPGWVVVVRQPLEQAYKPVDTIRSRILWGGLCAAALVSLLVWSLAKTITKPLATITQHAEALRAGHAEHIPPIRSRLTEVKILERTLNALVSKLLANQNSLRELNATLETRVQERTIELRASERSLRTITNHVPVLIAYVDRAERYQFANATYEEWFGIPASDILGKTVGEVMGDASDPEHQQLLQRHLAGETIRFEMTIPMQDAQRIIEVTRIPDIFDGEYQGAYVLGADISAAKLHEEELSKLARIDMLTGLPNRRAYADRLEAALQRAQRSENGLALMYLDVDHFKQVNDTLGHAAGDTVLHEFAQRVRAAVRVTDTVCRLAGDEFTVILEGLKSPEEASLVAAKILRAFERPFMLDQGQRLVSTSIGVAYTDAFPVSAADLGSEADKALYASKSKGRRCFSISRLPGSQASDSSVKIRA